VYPGSDQKKFALDVKTLPAIMRELGHKYIDVIKVLLPALLADEPVLLAY
jgi:hypothetical protein